MKALRNTSAYMIAGLLPSIVNLLLMPVYTRFLTPDEFGLVSVVLSIKVFLAAIMGLQIVNSISRLYFDFDDALRPVFVSTLYISSLVFNMLVIGGVHIFGDAFTQLMFPKIDLDYRPMVLLALLSLFFTTQVNFGNALLRVLEKGGAILIGGVSYSAFSLIFGLYFVVYREMGAVGMLMAQVITTGVHSLVLLFLAWDHLVFRWKAPMLFDALRYSLPLIPHSFGGILFMYTDKYILSFYVPIAAIGLYELAGRIANMFRMVIASFNSAITPDFMRSSKKNPQETAEIYGEILLRLMAVLAIGFLAISLFAPEIIALLAPPNYKGAHVYVPILLAGFLLRAVQGFAVNAILFVKKTRIIPLITLFAGLLNVYLNIQFIPRYGVIAAAWTTFASYAVTCLLYVYLSKKYYPIIFHWQKLGLLTLVFGTGLFIGWSIPPQSFLLSLGAKMSVCFLSMAWVWFTNFGGIREEITVTLQKGLTSFRK